MWIFGQFPFITVSNCCNIEQLPSVGNIDRFFNLCAFARAPLRALNSVLKFDGFAASSNHRHIEWRYYTVPMTTVLV